MDFTRVVLVCGAVCIRLLSVVSIAHFLGGRRISEVQKMGYTPYELVMGQSGISHWQFLAMQRMRLILQKNGGAPNKIGTKPDAHSKKAHQVNR